MFGHIQSQNNHGFCLIPISDYFQINLTSVPSKCKIFSKEQKFYIYYKISSIVAYAKYVAYLTTLSIGK